MFGFCVRKIFHKKWMALCLLLGNVLLLGTAVSVSLFKDSALKVMLEEKFDAYYESEGVNPELISLFGQRRKDSGQEDFAWMMSAKDSISSTLGITETGRVTENSLLVGTASYLESAGEKKENFKCRISSISGLEDHVQILGGNIFGDENGDIIDAVVSMEAFINLNLLIGDELEFPYIKDENDEKVRIRIAGVIDEAPGEESFFVNPLSSYANELFIRDDIFNEKFILGGKVFEYDTDIHIFFDKTKLDYKEAGYLYEKTSEILGEKHSFGGLVTPSYMNFLPDYLDSEKKIMTTILILEVPLFLLLCSFLFMISGQMLRMEESEIALMRSRGATRVKIFMLYLWEILLILAVSAVLAFPLGIVLCKGIGSVSEFLAFDARRAFPVTVGPEAFLYAGFAAVISLLVTLIPALFRTGITIVQQKRARARKKKPFWQKAYLDVILILVSLYGFYVYKKSESGIGGLVLSGESLDPLLYMCASLFILGSCLFAVRLCPLPFLAIYKAVGNKLKPAGFVSFLQTIRSGQRQYFIMIFMMITVSLGIFSETTSHTIVANADENAIYEAGADMILLENWKSNEIARKVDPSLPLKYEEPDFGKYSGMPGVEHTAKVYRREDASSRIIPGEDILLMGIHTRDFGLATNLPEGITPEHYYTYLNELAVNPDNILVSSSFHDELGLNIGDEITFTAPGENTMTGRICDFIDYFPSYVPKRYEKKTDGSVTEKSCYLIVAHLDALRDAFGLRPYEIWFDLEDDTDVSAIYDYINSKEIELRKLDLTSDKLAAIRRDPLFEGTNGILTMSFVIILVLCSTGYLIYNILSIKERELMFGVLRAMGMTKKEILRSLFIEQVFGAVLPIILGTGIGFAASYMYVPMIQSFYGGARSLPMELITDFSDVMKMFAVIIIALLICFIMISRQIGKLRISDALKLGEE